MQTSYRIAELRPIAMAGLIRDALGWVRELVERARQRRQLAELDARLLKDIGLTESDVLRETAKPIWKP